MLALAGCSTFFPNTTEQFDEAGIEWIEVVPNVFRDVIGWVTSIVKAFT